MLVRGRLWGIKSRDLLENFIIYGNINIIDLRIIKMISYNHKLTKCSILTYVGVCWGMWDPRFEGTM